MTKIFIALAALTTVAQPALAETFTRDGSTYTYELQQRGKSTYISGHVVDTKEPFELRVSGTRITGYVAGRPVSFSTRDVVSSRNGAKSAEIAAR